MKVSRIEIKDFQQFKDFELDLTYPKNHPTKAGKPLDKVCFIGQSGTGKTTILKIIKEFLDLQISVSKDGNSFLNISNYITINKILVHDIKYSINIVNSGKDIYKVSKNKKIFNYDRYQSLFFIHNYNQVADTFRQQFQELNYIFFNAELLDKHNEFIENNNINTKIYITDDPTSQQQVKAEKIDFAKKRAYDFSIDSPVDIWKMVLHQAKSYMVEEIKYTRELSKLMVNDIDNASKFIEEIKVWRKSVVNPFQELAKKANTFLHNFNLELKVNMDFENPEDMKFILVQPLNKHKEKLDYQTWSTGTKQVVMTATPLFALDTKDTIIMFDEPERSLFPDVQRTLIKYYTELAPEAQFFFATHSPIIASQFEPCERFILTFDEETGFVKVHNGIAPEGDDSNDLLSKDFDTEILTEKGVEKYQEFLKLRNDIRKAKDGEEKDNLLEKYLKIGNDYNFRIAETSNKAK